MTKNAHDASGYLDAARWNAAMHLAAFGNGTAREIGLDGGSATQTPAAGTGQAGSSAAPYVDPELDRWDMQGQQPAVQAVGKEGAQGAWGVARKIAGPNAGAEEVNRVKNQLLFLNPELVDGVKAGQRYYVPDAHTPENLEAARQGDARWQNTLADQQQAKIQKDAAEIGAQNGRELARLSSVVGNNKKGQGISDPGHGNTPDSPEALAQHRNDIINSSPQDLIQRFKKDGPKKFYDDANKAGFDPVLLDYVVRTVDARLNNTPEAFEGVLSDIHDRVVQLQEFMGDSRSTGSERQHAGSERHFLDILQGELKSLYRRDPKDMESSAAKLALVMAHPKEYQTNQLFGNFLAGAVGTAALRLNGIGAKAWSGQGRLPAVTEAEAYELRRKTIAGTSNASPEGKKVANDALDYVLKDPDAAIREYSKLPETRGGKVINTDYGRELIPAVAASKEARLAHSDMVQRPIGWLMDRLYRQKLQEKPKYGERPEVFITAGGPGSGKTSAINNIAPLKKQMDEAQIIRDTTLTWRDSSINMIDAALTAGKRVTVVYVDRDPVQALTKGILPRAKEEGRTVGIDFAAESHASAPNTIQELAKHYEGNPNVKIRIVNNRGSEGEAKIVDISSIQPPSQTDLSLRLRAALDEAYKNGEISKAVYEKTKAR
jgi:hypothetical protein